MEGHLRREFLASALGVLMQDCTRLSPFPAFLRLVQIAIVCIFRDRSKTMY